MRVLLAAFWVLLGLSCALAQQNCPLTPASGTNNTTCANTAFVQKQLAAGKYVIGPNSSVDGDLPQFSGATGLLLKDSGFTPAMLAPASGRLIFVNATTLKFAPYNGAVIRINGVAFPIPSGGIAGCANTSVFVNGTGASNLGASTFYYIYAFSNSGTVTCDFRTDGNGHEPDTTAGNIGTEVRISSGTTPDPTRTLIGAATTNGSSQFAAMDAISWFNRVSKSAGQSQSGNAGTTAISLTTWAEESLAVSTILTATDNTTNANLSIGNQIDGSSVCGSITATVPVATGDVALSNLCATSLAEGHHSFAATFNANAGTASYVGFSTAQTRG